jgi:hypothetical protein
MICTLLSSSLRHRSRNAEIKVAQLIVRPYAAIGAYVALLFRILWVLSTRTKESAIKVVLIIGRALSAVAETCNIIVWVIRNVHFLIHPFYFVSHLPVTKLAFYTQLVQVPRSNAHLRSEHASDTEIVRTCWSDALLARCACS